MALIKDRKGRRDGGYGRLFGDTELGELISKVQAAVISSGTELERIIADKMEKIEALDDFLTLDLMPDGVFLAIKKQIKASEILGSEGSEPDFVIFRRRDNKQHCHLVELKDGDTFDTKKAAAERTQMYTFIRENAQHLSYKVSAHFCCFNQDSREAIHQGFKSKIEMDEAMTGREFCELLEIDYDEIVQARTTDQSENMAYFVRELAGIKAVRDLLLNHFPGQSGI